MSRIALPAAAVVLMLAATACAPMPPRAMAPPPAAAGCHAEAAGWAIGRAVDQELVNRVIYDTGSRTARVIRPGEAVTMEYLHDRVNIKVNERGAIHAITCG